jgi:hypothetical protein
VRVVSVGATNFRAFVPESSVSELILAYNHALTAPFVSNRDLCFPMSRLTKFKYLSVGACCITFAVAWGMGWTNLKANKENETVGVQNWRKKFEQTTTPFPSKLGLIQFCQHNELVFLALETIG